MVSPRSLSTALLAKQLSLKTSDAIMMNKNCWKTFKGWLLLAAKLNKLLLKKMKKTRDCVWHSILVIRSVTLLKIISIMRTYTHGEKRNVWHGAHHYTQRSPGHYKTRYCWRPLNLIEKFGLPTAVPDYNHQALLEAMTLDKKILLTARTSLSYLQTWEKAWFKQLNPMKYIFIYKQEVMLWAICALHHQLYPEQFVYQHPSVCHRAVICTGTGWRNI